MSKKPHDNAKAITTPTRFGSHRSMIVDPEPYGFALSDGEVVCKDDDGPYITLVSRLDTGLADPRRYSRRSE